MIPYIVRLLEITMNNGTLPETGREQRWYLPTKGEIDH